MTVEYSWDGTSAAEPAAGNTALWLEAGGSAGIASYRVNLIRSGANFGGYYQNLDYRSADFTLNPWKKLQVRGSYLDQRRNTAILPYFLPFYDRTVQAGFQVPGFVLVRPFPRAADPRPARPLPRRQVRLSGFDLEGGGSLAHFGPLNLQGYLDIGRTHNTLTGESEHLAEYTFRQTPPSSSTGSRWVAMSITGTRRKRSPATTSGSST